MRWFAPGYFYINIVEGYEYKKPTLHFVDYVPARCRFDLLFPGTPLYVLSGVLQKPYIGKMVFIFCNQLKDFVNEMVCTISCCEQLGPEQRGDCLLYIIIM